ncbi:MAG TPA: transposase, partial [Clostridiales bacterium]|nr:transposase [Clostridiales bacterium]
DLFKTWLKNIMTKGMNKKETEVIEIILYEKETEQMIYSLEGVILKAIQEGKAEGKAEGKLDEKMNIAKKLMDTGILNLEQISEVTGLSIEELRKL